MPLRDPNLSDEDIRIPEHATTYDGFVRWVESGDFPEVGRIDYLGGEIYVDVSPEDLFTHGAVKGAVAATLLQRIADEDLGDVFPDGTWVRSRFAQLSTEPDVVVLLESSLASGKVRLAPAASRNPDRHTAVEGPPDLVVEVVSDSSVQKDTEKLPAVYARAGVPELWLVDARGGEIVFKILTLRDGGYEAVEADADGWVPSPRLGASFRLSRRRHPRVGTWRCRLEDRDF